MRGLQKVLDTSVANADVPFAVGMVGDRDGVRWSGSAGDAAPGRKASTDTLFRIFSMTKAIGSTAAMILIDRGKLAFDTPVDEVLPEFAKIQVLDRFDGDRPVLRAPRRRATVANLATHTSGLEYEFWNADAARYMAVTGHPTILSGTKASMFYPMMTDPGTRWGYGPSIDWLGLVVEKISGKRIDTFLADEIFGPLGMTDTTVAPTPGQAARLATVAARGEDGTFQAMDLAPPADPEVYGMGHALYSTAPDYLRFLRMMLNGGTLDGKRVLSESSVANMLQDRMGGLTFQKMITAAPPITADCDPFPGVRKTHSFAFMRNETDVPGMRSAGSQSWAGVLNTHYWFDPTRNVCAVIMTQTLPFVEPGFSRLYENYERAVYANL